VTKDSFGFLRFALRKEGEEKVPDDILDAFEDHLVTGLRKNDVVSRYSGNFYVLMTGTGKEECAAAAEKLLQDWQSSEKIGGFTVELEMENES
jgi:energy-coupling factor transport system substrate-specific component